MSVGLAIGLALILVLSVSMTANGAVVKKTYTATLSSSPSPAITGQEATYTITVKNTATSQSLGSCNLSKPATGGFTLSPPLTQPSSGTVAISADGNAVELRNMAALPTQSRTATFRATATTAGTYTWGINCRQANNYSPDTPSNTFSTTSVLTTQVANPPTDADLAVTGNSDNPDPVVGTNIVQYDVTVANLGPNGSGDVTLADSVNNGAVINSASGDGWTCGGTGGSTSCTHAPLTNGETASVTLYVKAPNADTTITNSAVVSQSGGNFNDPSGNNSLDQSTTVNKDSTCGTGTISCGTGRIVYNQPSSVTTGSTPTQARFFVGTTSFNATAASGSQNWSMVAPAVPGNFCPTSLADVAVTQCTFQMNLDIIPAPYTVPGQVTFVGICHRSKCPKGVINGLIVVFIRDDGSHEILPQCNAGDTRKCYTSERTAVINGDLRVIVRNMTAGDPKVGGICVGGGC